MDPRKLFVDERLTGLCCYCGNYPDSRDHIPSRVLLDEPFPSNLPVVEACGICNGGFSQDEEYLACLVECVICGTTEPDALQRQKIGRILRERPLLMARIQESRVEEADGNLLWRADNKRVRNVVLKLARGNLAFELNVFHFEDPSFLEFKPLVAMTEEERAAFESLPGGGSVLYPEIGSRAFISMWKSDLGWNDWREVQPGRYRYRVEQSYDGDKVQFVISEYLACTVIWE
jgi:hypothetical protein